MTISPYREITARSENCYQEPNALADLAGVPGARPLWDPILSFSHVFSPKCAHIKGPCPPITGPHPPGNPGSATAMFLFHLYDKEDFSVQLSGTRRHPLYQQEP